MRSPEQIAADLDDLAEALDEQGMPQSAEKCREVAEALRQASRSEVAHASMTQRLSTELMDTKAERDRLRLGLINAGAEMSEIRDERDALIAYLTAWHAAYPEDSMWEALPELVRQRIEAPDA